MSPIRICLTSALLALALLSAGCSTTQDARGNEIPPGEILAGERYDDLAAIQNAQTIVVIPFGIAGQIPPGTGGRALESAALIVSEEVVESLHQSGRLRAVGFGDGSEGSDLVITGRVTRYIPPTKTTDVLVGGIQTIEITGEILESGSGRMLGAYHAKEKNSGRKWWDNEERDAKRLARLAGKRIAAAILRQLSGR